MSESPFYSTDQFIAKHQAFTMSWLRSLIKIAETNGLISSGAMLRAGRKILIDEPKFLAWLKEKNAVQS